MFPLGKLNRVFGEHVPEEFTRVPTVATFSKEKVSKRVDLKP